MTWKTRPIKALHEQWKPTAPLELITFKDWNVSHFCRAHSRFQGYKLRGNVSVVFGLSYRSHCKSHLACFTLDFTTPPSIPWPPASPLQHPGDRALVDSLVGFHQQIQLSTRRKYGKWMEILMNWSCWTMVTRKWSLQTLWKCRRLASELKISWESHWRIFGAPGLQASIFGSPVFLDAPPDLRPGWVLECLGSEDLVGGWFYELKHYKINF